MPLDDEPGAASEAPPSEDVCPKTGFEVDDCPNMVELDPPDTLGVDDD